MVMSGSFRIGLELRFLRRVGAPGMAPRLDVTVFKGQLSGAAAEGWACSRWLSLRTSPTPRRRWFAIERFRGEGGVLLGLGVGLWAPVAKGAAFVAVSV